MAAFRRAAELQPQNFAARANLGAALVAAGRQAEGRAELEAVLAADPGRPLALLQLATLLAADGDEERAAALLRRLLEAEPQHRQALINLGNLLRRRGAPGEAAALYARALPLDSRNAELRLALIRVLVAADRDGDALAVAERAYHDLPEEPLLENALARLLAGRRDGERDGARALGLARRAFERSATLPVVETLAMASAEMGDFAAALAWQERAIEVARAAGRLAANPHLELNAERYRQGLAAAAPWP